MRMCFKQSYASSGEEMRSKRIDSIMLDPTYGSGSAVRATESSGRSLRSLDMAVHKMCTYGSRG